MEIEYQRTLDNIRNEIKSYYGTQKEFAIRSGITETQVSRILNGQRGITLKNFMRICYATGKTPNELMGWK